MDFKVIGSLSPRDKALLDRFLSEKPPNVYYLGPATGRLRQELVQQCSVGLTTSTRETFGWVPFEFITQGKPIIGPPLRSFKEIYGDLVIYATTTNGFIERLRELRKNRFRPNFGKDAILQLKNKYDLSKAAERILESIRSDSLTIFTRDTSSRSTYIAGFHLVSWRLWKRIEEKGARLQIVSNGNKYAAVFHLESCATSVPNWILFLKDKMNSLEETTQPLELVHRKILRAITLLLEPLWFVFSYIGIRKRMRSEWILAEGDPQMLAAVLLKFVFGSKIACLLHDDPFYRTIWQREAPLAIRIYNLVINTSLRKIDNIIVVSKMLQQELLNFYPHRERVIVMWPN